MSVTNRLKGTLGNFGLLIGSILVTFLALEVVVRMVDLRSASYHPISGFCRYDEVLGWRLIPGKSGLFKGRKFEAQVEHSAQGLRDRIYPYPREKGRRRILVLGDSVVWCWGVEMPDCFTEIVERELNGTDVIAAGVPGYGTAQELLFYERELARFEPDLVLLVFGINDLNDNLEARSRPVFELHDGDLVLTNTPVPRRKSAAKEWLLDHSSLFGQLNYSLQVARQMIKMAREGTQPDGKRAYPPLSPARASEAWRIADALIDRLRDRVVERGGRLGIVHTGGSDEIAARLERHASRRQIPFIDLSGPLNQGGSDGTAMLLPGDPHYSPQGHAVVAQAVLSFIRDGDLLGHSAAVASIQSRDGGETR